MPYYVLALQGLLGAARQWRLADACCLAVLMLMLMLVLVLLLLLLLLLALPLVMPLRSPMNGTLFRSACLQGGDVRCHQFL